MKPKKNILVCPLDWGLGHATRCVSVINELLRLNFNVIIGADKNPLAFLKQEFPELATVVIPGYDINYDKKGSSFHLFCESVRFYNFIKKEHALIDAVIDKNNIDIIISDNRYGLWSKKIKSILITHQLYIKTPFGSQIAHKKTGQLLNKFDEVWIPDYARAINLSGDLSHLKPFEQKHKFIGSLSRFSSLHAVILSLSKEQRSNIVKDYEYDIIAILSGPEPQRTIFEEIVLMQTQQLNLKAVVVRGKPSQNAIAKAKDKAISSLINEIPSQARNDGSIKIFNHLSTNELYQYIQQSKIVVCRSGYSSIMDLATLGKKAILVPTPKQTEQEYLAQYHFEKGNFYMQKQNDFNLEKGLVEVDKFTPQYNNKNILNLDFLIKKL